MELDDGTKVVGGAWSSPVRQWSGEHCAGEHHLHEAVSTSSEQEGRGEHFVAGVVWTHAGRVSTPCSA